MELFVFFSPVMMILLVIITSSFCGGFFCHLSCCHFIGMNRPTSDTKATSDVIIAVKSFPFYIKRTKVVIYPAASYCYLQATSYLGKGPLLTVNEGVPNHPSRY